MTTLSRELRKQLENTIVKARRVGEEGARKALEQLAVHHHEAWPTMAAEQRGLRNRLRAHGRQLGDKLDEKHGTQTIDRLAQECSYEHWHRMLFARFLAENDLLIEPETSVPISLAECQELARDKNTDWLLLASQYAVRMLPQIFRAGDPVLEISLPPETRQALQSLLESLPRDVFAADDSLGWVYQFWQAEQKEEINKSEKKIGADELAAVTQLFTEDYMVLFLLHNTLGAWWAGKVLAAKPEIASQAKDEDELRAACSVGGYEWIYLRFVREGENGVWRPAAGSFDGWPRAARDLRVLDPCEGSGHFLVFALPILVALRMDEEGLSQEQAVDAVLRDNLFGLELDNRCTQIAAFNLALAAWKMAGYRPLPRQNIACSGLGIHAEEKDWVKLAGKDSRLRETMEKLYALFREAPLLGSLIEPRRVGGTLFAASFDQVRPILEKALASEETDVSFGELAVAAQGILDAARILADTFALVATNVPYLGRGKQSDELKEYCDRVHPRAKSDLATCFIERCTPFNSAGGTTAVMTPRNWTFATNYQKFREAILKNAELNFLAIIDEGGFESPAAAGAFPVATILTRNAPSTEHVFAGTDASSFETTAEKSRCIALGDISLLDQRAQLSNPDSRILLSNAAQRALLARLARSFQGIKTGDDGLNKRNFWEFDEKPDDWTWFRSTVDATVEFGGGEFLVRWDDDGSNMARLQGQPAWGHRGIAVSLMRELRCSLYLGEVFDSNVAAVVPTNSAIVLPLWLYCASGEFDRDVRALDPRINAMTGSLTKVPFDSARWIEIGKHKYPDGLPKPESRDANQWLFLGDPHASLQPLQVAVARLVGYRWPRQTGSSFMDCPALGPDGLEKHADGDGIVCLNPVKGQLPAADRLRALLADAFGKEWSGARQAELLSQVGYDGESLEDWLRNGFFEQHCELFHQRPFIWHIWDGLKDGFHALVNYHKLAAPNGEGRRTLEKLIYTYLGDWITKQRDDVKKGVEGSDARLAAAVHLKEELEKILKGEKPYDIFVRWKPLREQPIGWDSDLNDGVRINIRPFMTAKPLNGRGRTSCILRVTPNIKWEKDRGKEPHRAKEDYPWFWKWDGTTEDFAGGREFDGNRWNDLHYSLAFKQAARQRARKVAR